MRVLFTCGGTAGHVNPALALAKQMIERNEDCEILFVGADGGMECNLIPREGFPIETVTITNFQRSLAPADIVHNLRTLYNMQKSKAQAKKILDRFQPDLVVGTGGYASYPVVNYGARRGIPTAVHESNAVPGLTTKALSKVVDCVMVGVTESRDHYANPEKVIVTGTPVRGDFFQYTRQEARSLLGITDDRPLLLSYWGSLGATVMNGQMVDVMEQEVAEGCPFHHIHGAGRGYHTMVQSLGDHGISLEGTSIQLKEYIYDMPLVMAACDLVLCRGGASTLSEIAAIGKPSIIVPSPNVTANHQEKNARVLEGQGGAVVLLERELDGKKLYRRAKELLNQPAQREEMQRNLTAAAVTDASERIYTTLMALMEKKPI